MDFDYTTAWHELAKPSYKLLPVNVRDLFDRVIDECEDCNQKANLDTRWPTLEESNPMTASLRACVAEFRLDSDSPIDSHDVSAEFVESMRDYLFTRWLTAGETCGEK